MLLSSNSCKKVQEFIANKKYQSSIILRFNRAGKYVKCILAINIFLLLLVQNGYTQRKVEFDKTYGDLRIIAPAANDELGSAVAQGDINGDYIPDMIVGAPGKFAMGHTGEVYVIYGSHRFKPEKEINLSTTPADITIKGKSTDDRFGIAVTCGDINGDHVDDIIIGAKYADPPGRHDGGIVYVIYGSRNFSANHTIDLSVTQADMTILGEKADDYLGYAVATGDINKDGKDDLLLGANWADPASRNRAGKVYAIFGAANFPANHSIDLNTTNADIAILGANAVDELGSAIAAGDVDGDSTDDLIISGYNADAGSRNSAGKIYIFYGATTWTPQLVIDLNNTAADLTILGPAQYLLIGDALTTGDFNDDNIQDVLIGASYASPVGQIEIGRAYVLWGSKVFPANHTIDLATYSDITILGEKAGDHLGSSVSSGDVNGDGIDDFMIGAIKADATGGIDAGKVFMFSGSASFPANHVIDLSATQADLTVSGEIPGAHLGSAVASADFDNNGLDDLFMGTDGANASGSNVGGGKAFMLYGFCEALAPTIISYIQDVPDVNQPPNTTLPSTLPDNFCAPTAAVNILGYWDTTMVHNNARDVTATLPFKTAAEYIGYFMDTNNSGSSNRANGAKFPPANGTYVIDQIEGLKEYIRWDNVMNEPGAVDVMNGWTRDIASDSIGWFMDTGNFGSPNRFNNFDSSGTYNMDIEAGFSEFVQWSSSLLFGHFSPSSTKKSYNWGIGIDYGNSFQLYKSEIDNDRPALVVFQYWNLLPTQYGYADSISGDSIHVFEWGPKMQNPIDEDAPFEDWNFEDDMYGIGHAVTGVGYCENYDPDGPGSKFKPSAWAIVHDNWHTTPMNIAIPWTNWTAIVAVKVYPPTNISSYDEEHVIKEFSLQQNYPNPFNSTTRIVYELPQAMQVDLTIYDITGRIITTLVNEFQTAGFKMTTWNGLNYQNHAMPTGIYIYQIKSPTFLQSKKLLLMK